MKKYAPLVKFNRLTGHTFSYEKKEAGEPSPCFTDKWKNKGHTKIIFFSGRILR